MASGGASTDPESPFIRIPSDLRLKIFARLGAEDLSSAKSVCRDWSRLLNNPAIQALALTGNPSICTTSSFFLVTLSYEDPLTEERKQLYVGVDHSGRWSAVDMLNAPLHGCRGVWAKYYDGLPDWDSSCHGFVVSFPKWNWYYDQHVGDYDHHEIIVCHPSLRRFRGIAFDHNKFITRNAFHYAFKAACYDPCTSHFTLLIGRELFRYDVLCTYDLFGQERFRDDVLCTYEIHLYSSESRQWKTIVREEPCFDDLYSYKNENALFSQGCFFWMDKRKSRRDERALVVFDLSTEQFHRMSLPQRADYPIKYLDIYIGNGYFEHYGELKGCDGNLVFYHYSTSKMSSISPNNNQEDDDYDDDPFYYDKPESIIGWRLDQSGSMSNWKWQIVLQRRPFHRLSPPLSLFDTDRSGWWLWTDSRGNFTMLDDKGEKQHFFPSSVMFSLFSIPPDSHCLRADNIWVLDTNNLWELLAFS